MKKFDEEFNKFKEKLEKSENFAFSRFSDGEIFIMQNKRVTLSSNFYITGDKAGKNIYGPEERKEFIPGQHEIYRTKLLECFNHEQEGYYKGIPSQQDIHVDFKIDKSKKDLTFANLFINANYKRFVKEIVESVFPKKNIVYVVNKRAELSGLPFSVKKDFRIGSNCMINDYHLIKELPKWIEENGIENHVFLFSAASLSNFLIYECFKKFPENVYLDIGSSLNPYLGEDMKSCLYTRDYLRSYWLGEKTFYGEQIDEW